MTSSQRRSFIINVCAGAGALAASRVMAADAAPVLTESDPQAVALGYRLDSSKVDRAKYPQHQPTQMCSHCNFFQGKPADAMAPCQIFAGKQVSAKGWCSAFVKKA